MANGTESVTSHRINVGMMLVDGDCQGSILHLTEPLSFGADWIPRQAGSSIKATRNAIDVLQIEYCCSLEPVGVPVHPVYWLNHCGLAPGLLE